MKLSVIIVNYNSFALTCNCIKSVINLTRHLDYEIILVDNASTDFPPEKFKEEFPRITLVKSERNGGFAYGNNLGLEKANGDYILLLNSDTLLTEDSISKCVSVFAEQPAIGVLGCRMVFPDGKIQHTARRFRSVGWELLDLFRFIPFLMSYKKRAGLMLGKYFRHDENIEADWLNGAFFMFPRIALNNLPAHRLDERFFMYGEDQLWCEQIKKAGYRIFFYAGTTIIHINSGSTEIKRQLSLRKTMMQHEFEIMRERRGKGVYYFLFRLIFGAKEGIRNFFKRIVFGLTGKIIRS